MYDESKQFNYERNKNVSIFQLSHHIIIETRMNTKKEERINKISWLRNVDSPELHSIRA